MGADDTERPTVSTTEAASALRLTPRRVLQLIDDPTSPLDGTPGAGHGQPRQVFLDSITWHQQARLPGRTRSRAALAAAVHDLQHTVQQLTADLSTLTATVDHLPHNAAPTREDPVSSETHDPDWLRSENEQLRFELAKSNAASDALRDAVTEQAAAADLYRQAADHEARARQALTRAEKARDDSRRSPPN